jgi:Orsellinic acid/F9775 biosynthesis cluster protein D
LDLNFHVLMCTRCQYALVPGTVAAHLASIHQEEVAKDERRDCVELWKDQPLQLAKAIQQYDLPLDTHPIPNLALHHNGIRCCLCTKLAFVCNSPAHMQRHLKKVHGWIKWTQGRPASKSQHCTGDRACSRHSIASVLPDLSSKQLPPLFPGHPTPYCQQHPAASTCNIGRSSRAAARAEARGSHCCS